LIADGWVHFIAFGTVYSLVLQTMKVSTLLFQAAALVGAVSFSKAEEFVPVASNLLIESGFIHSRETEFSLAIDDALNAIQDPEDYKCEVSALGSYVSSLLDGGSIVTYRLLVNDYGVKDWLYVATLWYNDGTDNVFGNSQEQTDEFRNYFLNLTSWEPDLDGTILKNFNGDLFRDTDLMVKVLYNGWYSHYNVDDYPGIMPYVTWRVKTAQWFMESDERFGYDSPLWSLNAFAIRSDPVQIHFGDGVLDFFNHSYISDGGPDFVLAHEFAHLIQYNLNVVFENTPESTRKTELMADAISAYYLTHEEGAAFQNNDLIEELTKAASYFGDCGFDYNGHHGTPNQRKAAAVYGIGLAAESSTILTPAQFIAKFKDDYDTLINPDSHKVCENFAVHARTNVTFAGATSMIHGDVSVSPGTSVTGSYTFLDGGELVADSSDFAASVFVAYTTAMAVRADEQAMAIEIGGETFSPGTHRSDSAINFANGTVVTLDGQGETDPVFLFQAGSTLVTAADTHFILKNGAKAENVYWALGTNATLGANSVLEGSILAGTAITFGTKSVLHGCALAQSTVTFESEGSVDVYERDAVSTRHLRGLN
jgi:hypothetical protein